MVMGEEPEVRHHGCGGWRRWQLGLGHPFLLYVRNESAVVLDSTHVPILSAWNSGFL
jgi:hypothetical protein